MKFSQRYLSLVSLSSLLALAASFSYGQTSRGTLTGTVTDSSGAVIAKANVSIKQAGTNVTRQTSTNEAGIYRFDAVDLGTYTLTVQAPGFPVLITTTRPIDLSFSVELLAESGLWL